MYPLQDGSTTLQVASYYKGNSAVMKTLIKYGANIDHLNKVIYVCMLFDWLLISYWCMFNQSTFHVLFVVILVNVLPQKWVDMLPHYS